MKTAVTVIQVLCGLFLIAVVLLQSGKSAGLSGAIAGGADTFLSKNKAKTVDAKLAKMDQVGGHRLYAAHPVPEPDPLTVKSPACFENKTGGAFL